MRDLLYPLLLLALATACSSRSPEAFDPGSAAPPNILLIMTDDQGYGDLSLHGNDSLQTPVLDRLAAESVQLDRFYVSPVCAPTRASLLTGRYHLRTGTSWVTHRKEVMRTSEVTLAEYLQEAGYRTGLFGKWHNGAQYPNDPIGQGFEVFFGFSAGHWNNYFDTRLTRNTEPVQTEGYITDVLTDSALAFIRRPSQRPFFCYVPYNAPHGPFQVPDRYYRRLRDQGLTPKNAAVYGMVENIDDNVGRLLSALDEEGLAERTIVVFLTDNGPNGNRFNGGMRGRKGQVHEGGVRVPCFVRWPGVLPAGKKVTRLTAHIDLLPTLIDLAGIALDTVNALDGRSLVPLLTEDDPAWPDRALFTVQTNGEPRLFPGAMRTPRYRLIIDRENNTQLYDMAVDPGQQHDLADSLRALTDSLRRIYESWFLEVSTEGFNPPPIPVGYPRVARTELPAPEARLSKTLSFAGGMGWANDYIVGWSQRGDRATWPIYLAADGYFELSVDYTATEDAVGASLRAQLGQQAVSGTVEEAFDPPFLPSPDRLERGEVYEKPWKTMSLGTLRLERGAYRLRLSLAKALPAGGLEVKAVRMERRPPQ